MTIPLVSFFEKRQIVFFRKGIYQKFFRKWLPGHHRFRQRNGHFRIVRIIPVFVVDCKQFDLIGIDIGPFIDKFGKINVFANPVPVLEFQSGTVCITNGNAQEQIFKVYVHDLKNKEIYNLPVTFKLQ
ncbi:hypothetical protein D3C86_1147260 [compost metagenome]